jgi:hypothetical protein
MEESTYLLLDLATPRLELPWTGSCMFEVQYYIAQQGGLAWSWSKIRRALYQLADTLFYLG